MIDTILDPQIWLVLVAVVHALVGVILPTEWEDDTNKLVSGWFLLTTVTMLGTAVSYTHLTLPTSRSV